MRLGMSLRNSGPPSTTAIICECATTADGLGSDDLWVLDHIAIPPDDAEGSNARYLDTLTTVAYVAATTDHVRLGCRS